jgi:hypothetical protein
MSNQRIRELAALQCTIAEAAGVFDCHRDTIPEFFRMHKKADEAWTIGQDAGRASLRRYQFTQAKRSFLRPAPG